MAMNPNLLYYCERMAGYSTNIFQLVTLNKDTATSSDIVTFDIPSNSICKLSSFKVLFNASANNGTANICARLPEDIRTVFERIEVTMGGIVLSQGTNFANVITEAKQALMGSNTNSLLSHPRIIRNKSYVDGTTIAGTANEPAPNVENGDSAYCCDIFEGFLATCAPDCLDFSIFPDCRVRLYMASNNILTTSASTILGTAVGSFAQTALVPAAPTGAAYLLTNLHAQIECMGFADSTLDNMISAVMSKQGFLECPYKAITQFSDTHQGSTRFSVSSASIDRVWTMWRLNTYNTQTFPITVGGYKIEGGFINSAATFLPATAFDAGLPQYDIGGTLLTNEERYKSNYFNFVSPEQPGTALKLQLQLNGAYFPQYSAPIGDLLAISQNSVEAPSSKVMTLDQYKKNFFVQCFRLNLPGSEKLRQLTGIDSRAVNLQALLRSEGITNSPNVNIFVETTAVLRVGSGRAIEIIS
jgi:hypothetical protein